MLTAKIFNAHDLHSLFKSYGRGEQYSRDGFRFLFDYLESLSDDMGEDIVLDVVSICCEWTEYDDIDSAVEAYGLDCEEDLQDKTTVLGEYGDGLSTSVMVLDC